MPASTPQLQLPTVSPTMTFDDAATSVLAFLRQRLPMGFWSVTRMENERQTYLHLDDRVYGLERGGSHAWEDSFCIKMMAGEGPMIAPDVSRVSVYLGQAVSRAVPIGAYAGIPIVEADGSLFGTLCGLNIDPMGPEMAEEEGLLHLLCQLLGMVLAADRARDVAAQETLVARLAADTDPLTGLYSRHAWNDIIAAEEAHQAKFADPTVIAIVDLDLLKTINDQRGHAAGDDHIRSAGRALRQAAPNGTPVARLGGDEFALLLRNTAVEDADRAIEELYDALEDAEVAGSIGWAPYTVITGFPGAMEQADLRMYAAKRDRRRMQRA